ncbi:secreted RxLR effector protein 161-like [Vicia villosa]|uniref:secreted RxLR effector protein 161-like n=1 Tax=Vicia villosa TaxID=3911 RepID=UPI00273BFB56|nr:secreted RxLR effector protein 161-like [Vicia villosa]
MSDLRIMIYFLSMEFHKLKLGLLMHLRKYALEILKKCDIEHCNATNTPTETRLMERPKVSHFAAIKRILRYVKGTLSCEILFPAKDMDKKWDFIDYTDSNWCGDKDDQKSTTGYVFMFGGAPISWCSKKELVVAFSL